MRCARSSWRSKPPRRGWNKQERARAFGLLRLPLEVQRLIFSYAVGGGGASIGVDCSTGCHVKYYRDGFQGCSLVSRVEEGIADPEILVLHGEIENEFNRGALYVVN